MPGLEILSDFTVRNALIGASLLGVVSGVLGTFAVLREQSLIGDAVSHAALPGICLGFLIAGTREIWPLALGALAAGAAAALAVLALTRYSRLKPDASLGTVLSTFFAAGTVLLTYIQNRQLPGQAGLDSFLFGQAAAVLPEDLWFMGAVALVALGAVGLFWKEFKLVAFDPGFARSLGLPVALIEAALTAMIALAVVVGLQLVGVVLMVAMVIAPGTAARQWCRRLETTVLLAAGFGAASGILGTMLSLLGRGLATGPLIVLVATGLAVVSLLFAPGRGAAWKAAARRRARAAIEDRHILAGMWQLAQSHGDAAYAVEQGMLDAMYGAGARGALERLERQGLVEPVTHMSEEGLHWRLTPEGRKAAAAEPLSPSPTVRGE
ncbi:MAG: metal ABC transporter permease [Firmicutes bacterium]|nr:metal ABC transporter permease [Bacillota bacterium]